jgi:outer membrane receptor for ferrienterochelin and colicin
MKQLRTWLAAVLVTVSCTWVLTPSAHADERTDARREFRQGMQMVAEGQYDEGIKHLERAYDILPHPNVLYNIALAHTYAGRADAAVYYFERYKETAPSADAAEVDAIVARLKTAQAAAEERPAVSEAPVNAEQARDELAVVTQAAAELRRVAEAQNNDALRKRADELDAAAARLRDKQGAVAEAPTGEQKPPTPGEELPTQPGALPQRPPELGAAKGAQEGTYEEQVVSASRLAQSPLDAPNATAIITAQDIRLTGLNNVNDLLRRVAGVEVNSMSPNHADIGIRGLNRRTSNKVLLLLDGRSLRQDFLGSSWYDFLPISVEDIERIEIIRGPASALYGADAFSGIINIITRAPGEGGNFVQGGVGNHDGGRAVASFNGKNGDLAYHFGFGYDQEDVSATQVGINRVDIDPYTDTPDVASKKAWANAELRYPFAKKSLVTIGGNVVQGDQIVHGFGRLLQTALDDATSSQIYGTITTPVGIRLATWWNHMDAEASLSTRTPGAVDETSEGTFDVADVDLSYSDRFDLGVPMTITIGGGYRFKGVYWSWLDDKHTQHHFGAYIQDVIEVTKALKIQIGARMDRHPLLDGLQFSPRGSIVYRILENQSVRLSAGRAFRGPSYLESYLEYPVGTPVRGVLAYGLGNQDLDPEAVTSFELGYQNQASDFFAFEANAYYNLVKDLIYLSDYRRFTIADFANETGIDPNLAAYDEDWDAFPLSTLRVTNQRANLQQIGGEIGARVFPITGFDLYANYSIHDTRPLDKNEVSPALASEQQTSLHKVNAGMQYRASFGLDASLDLHWFSDQLWVEQVTDTDRGVRDETFEQPAFLMVNARLGYRLLADRLELGVYGTNLTFNDKRQHPFGLPMDTRFMGTAKVRF